MTTAYQKLWNWYNWNKVHLKAQWLDFIWLLSGDFHSFFFLIKHSILQFLSLHSGLQGCWSLSQLSQAKSSLVLA